MPELWPKRSERPGTVAALRLLVQALDGAQPPCADDPELWFETDATAVTEALSGCRRCPGRVACALYAEELGASFGTWGGQKRTIAMVAANTSRRSQVRYEAQQRRIAELRAQLERST